MVLIRKQHGKIENYYLIVFNNQMNILDLPREILIIISDDMNDNILPISLTNKEFRELVMDRLLCEKEKVMEKKQFFERVIKPDGKFWDAFHYVQSLKECKFLEELCIKLYDRKTFISRARYTLGNTYQVATESWFEYFNQQNIEL